MLPSQDERLLLNPLASGEGQVGQGKRQQNRAILGLLFKNPIVLVVEGEVPPLKLTLPLDSNALVDSHPRGEKTVDGGRGTLNILGQEVVRVPHVRCRDRDRIPGLQLTK